jgi:hypothetical protein
VADLATMQVWKEKLLVWLLEKLLLQMAAWG